MLGGSLLSSPTSHDRVSLVMRERFFSCNARECVVFLFSIRFLIRRKRKKTDNPREGWENGTIRFLVRGSFFVKFLYGGKEEVAKLPHVSPHTTHKTRTQHTDAARTILALLLDGGPGGQPSAASRVASGWLSARSEAGRGLRTG